MLALLKQTPILVCLALGAYAVWPHVMPGAGPAAPPSSDTAGKMPDIDLEPLVPRTADRDPFLDADASRAAALASLSGMLQKMLPNPYDRAGTRGGSFRPIVPIAGRGTDRTPRGGRPPSPPAASAADDTAKAPEPPPDPRLSMVLNLTLIQGDRRVAMINNRVYKIGDTIQTADATSGSCILARVNPHDAVLLWEGRELTLNYPSPGDRPASAAPAKKAAEPKKATEVPGEEELDDPLFTDLVRELLPKNAGAPPAQ